MWLRKPHRFFRGHLQQANIHQLRSCGRLQTTQQIQTAVQIVSKPLATSNRSPIYRFGGSRPCRPAGCLLLLLIKVGDVQTNPGPTTSHKRVWIYDICYTQMHVIVMIGLPPQIRGKSSQGSGHCQWVDCSQCRQQH